MLKNKIYSYSVSDCENLDEGPVDNSVSFDLTTVHLFWNTPNKTNFETNKRKHLKTTTLKKNSHPQCTSGCDNVRNMMHQRLTTEMRVTQNYR